MKQITLACGGFEQYARTTKRATFLAEMNHVTPWGELCALIEQHYPKAPFISKQRSTIRRRSGRELRQVN